MNQDNSVDVVIVTALEKERDAVLHHLNSPISMESKNGVVYNLENSKTICKVLLLCLGRMGNVEAAIAVTQAISHWNPAAIILTGIMGGVRSSERSLGDLIVAEQIVGYELGKVRDTGMESRWEVLRPTHRLIKKARDFSPDKCAFRSIIPRPNGSTGRVPTVHFGVVASGEKVIADTSTIPELQRSWGKLIGVDMEGFGVASAVYRSDSDPAMFMVKGICDWADSNKNDDWQAYAADVAAAYVINFLKCNLGGEDGYLFKSKEAARLTDLLLESSGISKSKQENSPDLDFSAIPLESIQQAYRKALPPDADLWADLEENDVSKILETVKKHRGEGVFYELLNKEQQAEDFFYEERESYLIATIKPADDGEFTLKGWLVMGEHEDYFEHVNSCQSLLTQERTESEIKCKWDEVESVLDNFIERCFNLLPTGKKLIIEVFLPIERLHRKVEWWKITDCFNNKRPIGTEHLVRLRCVKRLEPKYLKCYLYKWREKWHRAKSVLEQKPIDEDFGYFHAGKNEDFTEAFLMNQLDDKIGVKLISCPPKQKRQELFMAIMKSGLPIVLWSRYNLDNRDREIERLFNLQPLNCLCDSIKRKRMEAVAQTDEIQKNKHLGSHLAVIWENPYRLTPDLIELMLPGK